MYNFGCSLGVGMTAVELISDQAYSVVIGREVHHWKRLKALFFHWFSAMTNLLYAAATA